MKKRLPLILLKICCTPSTHIFILFLVKSNNNSNKFRTCCSIKGATKLQTKVIIVSATKIGESTTKIISCFSLKKLNLPLTSGIYLVVLLLEMQRRLKQTKACHTFLLVCLKKSDPHILKSSSCKNPFLQFVCYRYDLLRWMFLFHVITGIHYFS